MDNRLDILTKKLYEEGVEKARAEAEEMVRKAKEDAAKIIEEAKARAEEIRRKAMTDAEGMRKKAETEMTLAARQAVAALKQEIGGLVAGKVAGEMAKSGWEDRTFVEELLMTLVKKWDGHGEIQGVAGQRAGLQNREVGGRVCDSAQRRELPNRFLGEIVRGILCPLFAGHDKRAVV